MDEKQDFTIKAPATSANLGPGFDSLGLALKIYNKFKFKKIKDKKNVEIHIKNKTAEKEIKIPKERNLLYQSMKYLFKKNEKPFEGFKIEETIRVPISRGLGSSATAILAGFFAANKYLGDPYSEKELLKMAIEMETHPDNVGSSFNGGLNIGVMTDKETIFKKVEVNQELKIVVIIPEFQLNTKNLRKVLPENVSQKDAVFNLSRTGLLVASFYDEDWKLLSTAMQDRIHQNYRSKLIPGFNNVLESANKENALGVALSGSGPSILAFTLENGENIGRAMKDAFLNNDINSKYVVTSVDNEGLRLID